MKLTILTDNIAGGRFLAEHGLSYLIEIDDEKILFDTGRSDVFLQNAKRLGIDIQNEVHTVVLSHGHWDHGNGLSYLSGKTLVTHPAAFSKRYRKTDKSYPGLEPESEELSKRYAIHTSENPVQITSNLWYLGEIPRVNDFEAQTTPYMLDNGEDDFIFDDSALVAVVGDEIVVVSGCAHSGICNICEYAKTITGITKIKCVIGGFHLKDQGWQTQKTLDYFIENRIENLLPSHCTELPAKALFRQNFEFPEVKTGMCFGF